MQTLTSGPVVRPPVDCSSMTLPSDIHVILPGPQRGVALRRLAAAGAGPRVVVLAETDSPSAVEPWVAPLREGRVDAVYAPRSHGARRLLGPGDGAFALRGAVLAGLDLTEDG